MDLLDKNIFEDKHKEQLISLSEKLNKLFIKSRSPATISYLKSRSLSDKEIDTYEWGTVAATSIKAYPQLIPIFKRSMLFKDTGEINFVGMPIYPLRHKEGYIIGWQIKDTYKNKYYTLPIQSITSMVYGVDRCSKFKDFVFLTEGWFDYHAVSKCLPLNYPVLCTLTANIRSSHIDLINRFFSRFIFLYDVGYWQTEAGKKTKERLLKKSILYSVIEFPELPGIKDWSDMLKVHGEDKTSQVLTKLIPELK